jgi:protein-disulfide isomerase
VYADTGLVRFEYKHFSFIGFESTQAAAAAECANEQGQFWPYHNIIFANQRGENQGAFNELALKNFATVLGLDEAAFNSCLDDNKYRQTVEDETAEGRSLGVRTTPTLYFNGEEIVGAVPFDQLQSRIEAVLSQQE